MKLYMHPLSTTCQPILMFVKDSKIDIDYEVVDLMKGEQYQDKFARINPNNLVPLLEDGADFRLTESSAILKYLADKFDSPAYPKALRERAKVNEMMDWFNTNFYREFGYNLTYPQLFDHHRRASKEAQSETLQRGCEQSQKYLKVLDQHWLAHGKEFLMGDKMTIADYFGAAILSLGELTACDLNGFPRVKKWYDTMKSRPTWQATHKDFDGLVSSLQGKEFARVA